MDTNTSPVQQLNLSKLISGTRDAGRNALGIITNQECYLLSSKGKGIGMLHKLSLVSSDGTEEIGDPYRGDAWRLEPYMGYAVFVLTNATTGEQTKVLPGVRNLVGVEEFLSHD